MSPKQKDALAPFAHAVAMWDKLITRMSDAELLDLRDACKVATETNCWWSAYDAAPVVLKLVLAERHHRSQKKNNPT